MYGLAMIFIVYSFVGWVLEVAWTATKEKHFVNKGFLNGAICPRYGVAMVIAMLVLRPVQHEHFFVFTGCLLIGTAVEYTSSLLLEKLTGTRWWDYTDATVQFRGRIRLLTAFFWGVGGTICFYLNCLFFYYLKDMEIPLWGIVFLVVFFLLFALDCLAACLTAMAIQDKFYFLLRMAARLRKITKTMGNRIFENSNLWRMKQEIRKESARVRSIYRKKREQRMRSWLEQRMILAAPELAADEETLQKLMRKQQQKKRQLFQKILLNRVLFTGIALIAQMIWIGIFLNRFAAISQEITLFMIGVSFLVTVYILTKNENSAYKMSWLILMLLLPVLGGILYVFFGNKNPSRKMKVQIEKIRQDKSGNLRQDESVLEEIRAENERVAGRCQYLYQKTSAPVWKNTETIYYPLGDDMFEDVLKELEKAEHFIFLEFFIIADGIFWGSIKEVLERKAKAGLDVRLMYDDVGCLMLLPKEYVEEMEAAGISCIAFNPFRPILSLAMNNRDHRKILVIDGHIAYTGGVNLADEYINMADRFGHWKDTAMKFTGDGVAGFTEMFLEMWNAFRPTDEDFAPFLQNMRQSADARKEDLQCIQIEHETWEKTESVQPNSESREDTEHIQPDDQTGNRAGYVQPFGDTPLDDEPTAENLYIDILNQACRYVYIYTPYLIIGDTMRHALCMAAARGVDVKIITPGIPDKKLVFRMTRSNYKELLKAGVEIYEYRQGFVHAKSYVSDDEHAVIGTINMDYRSLYLHFECGAYLYQTPSIMDMKEDFRKTLKKSRKIELSFLKQGFLQEVFDAVLAVIAPLV